MSLVNQTGKQWVASVDQTCGTNTPYVTPLIQSIYITVSEIQLHRGEKTGLENQFVWLEIPWKTGQGGSLTYLIYLKNNANQQMQASAYFE